MQTEKATYDPDLPHDWMRGSTPRECALCGRPGKDELHTVATVEQASATRFKTLLETEKGS